MSKLKAVIIILALVMSYGFLPSATFCQEDEDLGNGSLSQVALSLPIAYDIVYARSDTSPTRTETVVSIQNTTGAACDCEVEWLLGSGSTVGLSGPLNLAKGETREFTTANSLESVEPYVLNQFRDTTLDFEGAARVRTNCLNKRVGINATLVIDIDVNNVGRSYTSIKVIKPSKNKGD
jgi:hypothetical protein